ncbi:MAG: HNH endonuclease [Vitreimonas sp.]
MGVIRHGHAVYRDPRWPGLRLACKRRDNFRCKKCGGRGLLEVDHIKAVRDAPELAFVLSNLQSLCKPCHSAKTVEEIGLHPVSPERARWRDLLRIPTPKEPSHA